MIRATGAKIPALLAMSAKRTARCFRALAPASAGPAQSTGAVDQKTLPSKVIDCVIPDY